MSKIIIAIDGYSSCGKSTLAKALASALQYVFIDSGAMYRAVTYYLMTEGIDFRSRQAVVAALPHIRIAFQMEADGPHTLLNGTDVESDIRSMEVARNVSPVAAIPEVRHAMVSQQQQLGAEKGIVMDGRDIGTVVFPQAELKIFLTASTEERVNRRQLQLIQKGIRAEKDEIRKNLLERDYIDSTRSESPLRKAPQAVVIDNTNLNEREQLLLVQTLAEARLSSSH